jgi:hypothetical protein
LALEDTAEAGSAASSSGLAPRLRSFALEYVVPLVAAIAFTLVVTWPLPLYFAHAVIGEGDATGSLGTVAYWRDAFAGREPWFYATRLYYPVGISFATNSAGPFSALLALPFWGWGPAAAYNGAIVLGFALSGFCAYLLARDIGCSRAAAWLAGLMLMLAPLHVLAVPGHLNKVFLGFIALALLVTRRGMDPDRSPYWAIAVGPMLMLAFLQAPEQLVIAGVGCGFVAVYLALFGNRGRQPAQAQALAFQRLAWMGLSAGLCVLPLYLLMRSASAGLGAAVDVSAQSRTYQPDLLQFIVPPGIGVLAFQKQLNQLLTPDIPALVETAVYLTWGGLLLCLIAWFGNRAAVRMWLLLLLTAMVLALGPTLRAFGNSWVSQQDVPLPYAALNVLPGLRVMRTPGRFMLLGFTAFAMAAAVGMDVVLRRARPLVAVGMWGAVALLLVLEVWPVPYVHEALLPPPPFYQQIASDPERYGVLDLPIRPAAEIGFQNWHIYYSSLYQVDQITHGKGIATGYVSRHYATHPIFGQFISENFRTISPLQQDLTVDGEPSSRYANLRYDLAKNNYRYVVLHKPSEQNPVYKLGAWGEKAAERLVQDVFGDQAPIVDDAMTRVYEVGPAPAVSSLQPSIAMLEPAALQDWPGVRKAQSPTGFLVHSPAPIVTTLSVTAAKIDDDTARAYDYGILTVQSGDGKVKSVQPISSQETVRVPVALAPGSQVITTTVVASEGDVTPGKPLTITIDQIDLSTAPYTDLAITVDDGLPGDVQAAYGGGWYGPEGGEGGTAPWRWTASPAAVWVYSAIPQTVTLRATPIALHDAASADGKGLSGQLAVSLNGQKAGEWPAVAGQPLTIPIELAAGWNDVTLDLAAGNFKPVDVQPETGDSRTLSFALQGLAVGP